MRSLLLILALLLLGGPLAVPAQESGRQFLVLLDKSQSMASRESSASRRIRDLVRSGFQGQAAPGDRLDFWSFTSELKSDRFVTQVWSATNSPLLAELAGRYVETEKFGGRTRFGSFADEMNAWISRQDNALVLILTDGEDAVMNLPYDLEINEYIGPRRGQARTARRAFLVAYLVRDGRVAQWLAHDGLGPMQLPQLPSAPVPELPAPVAQAESRTEAKAEAEPAPPAVIELPPGAKVVQVAPTVPPAPAEPQAALPEAKEEPAAEEPKPAVPDATAEPDKTEEPPVLAVPPAEVLKETSEPASSAPQPPIAAAPVELPAEQQAEPRQEAIATQGATSTQSVMNVGEAIAAATPATNETAAIAATLVNPAPASNRSLYFLAGAGLVLALIAVVLLKRPRGNRASLISRSLSQK